MAGSATSLPVRPNVVWRLFVIDQLVGSLLEREFGRRRLRPGDFAVLSTIGVVQPVTPTDLAELLGMRPTSLSAALKRLGGGKLVSRSRNPADGRSVLLGLTAAGARRVEESVPALQAVLAGVTANLDIPVDALADALEAYERAARRLLDGSAKT
jgi:DNA-binding MarR family transcriptional regulator